MLNLLIAIMAKTFDNILESSTLNYQRQLAVVVLNSLELPAVPAPLSLLSIPYAILRALQKLLRQCARAVAPW